MPESKAVIPNKTYSSPSDNLATLGSSKISNGDTGSHFCFMHTDEHHRQGTHDAARNQHMVDFDLTATGALFDELEYHSNREFSENESSPIAEGSNFKDLAKILESERSCLGVDLPRANPLSQMESWLNEQPEDGPINRTFIHANVRDSRLKESDDFSKSIREKKESRINYAELRDDKSRGSDNITTEIYTTEVSARSIGQSHAVS
jgi:hypothetical protein